MENNTLLEKKTKPDQAELTMPKERFKIWSKARGWGIQAGALMGLYVFLLHLAGLEEIMILKFMKNLILIGMLGWVLHKYRKINVTTTFFQKSILLGGLISLLGAITFLLMGLVVNFMTPEYSFTRFGYEINSLFDFMIAGGGTFFEILVFGMIGTLIWLEYLKYRIKKVLQKDNRK